MNAHRGLTIGRSTVAAWLAEYRTLTTYARLRAESRRLFSPRVMIQSVKLYHHRQIYKYEYHRAKLALLRASREHARFAGVADFLERVSLDCPHDLFRESERASQTPLAGLKNARPMIVRKENAATAMAALVIPTLGDNRLRHEALQRFMLVNDSTTIAAEVPIWLPPAEVAALEREHGIALMRAAAASRATSTSCRCETAPSTSSTTSRTPERTGQSRSLWSTRLR